MPRVDLFWPPLLAAVLGLVVVLGLAGSARAERVRTTGTTKVYKGTGEGSGVVTKVASGKTLTVINTQGRWLKVRVNGRTGWVTRSSVKTLAESDVPRNTRRRPFVDGRSTRRGWGGDAPDDRVGADAVGDEGGGGSSGRDDDSAEDGGDDGSRDGDRSDGDDDRSGGDEPGDDEAAEAAPEVAVVVVTAPKTKLYPRASRKAKATRTLKRGAKLAVLDTQGNWIRVELGDDAGWVRADDVAPQKSVRVARVISTTARIGFASIGGAYRSNGPMQTGGVPASYNVGSNAISLTVGLEAAFAYKQDYFIGGGIEYLGCVATPGIRYDDGTSAEDIGFKTHDLDVRLLGGYDFHDSRQMTAWARVGYHLGITSFANLMNLADLPSETFRGPSIGAGVKVPKLTPKIGVTGTADVIYPGSRSQTVGNEDGAVDSAMAAWVSVVGDYAWNNPWSLQAGYRFGYAKTSWTGASNRVTGVTAASRRDLSHVLTLGVGRAF